MPPTYRYGKDAEDRLLTLLEKRGCLLQKGETLDRQFKLDCVVTRLGGIMTFLTPIGLQLTSAAGNLYKQRTFVSTLTKSRVVPRAVYVELESPEVDLETGAGEVIHAALVSFAFDKRYSGETLTGLRVNQDMSFAFFALPDLSQQESSDPVGIELTGMLSNRYNREKGYGFIDPDPKFRFTMNFFAHFDEFDQGLKDRIQQAGDLRQVLPLRVIFNDAGITKHGASARRAVNIRMAE